ncbi:hypothetical protein BHE90_003897 [Fusarium euwallaceae]|uniref:Protein RTA1 n=4 Tax=Fusarium solani species complex TaxID=232080 RepID=A0A3M2SFL6_9HYPO|nr:hypothetical protein CDV36_003962 [Fusarium kuroshium]RSL87595.1 hypothetical protein CEP51_002146 [Fusarium floridanum]RSM05022.1 hypothetical protein CEP52_006490 [Fusarium oligoseptatum]RTE81579.1 hypothetical protein BHE90_003897 [Fusarium euwallaceae]
MAGELTGPPPKYHYEPSLAAAILFAVLFSLSGFVHLYQLVRGKTWYFIAFFIGVLFEVVGHAARAYNASESPNWSDAPFIMQTLLMLLAPALFAASIYMILGRLIRVLDAEHFSIIRTRWLTKIFVLGDVLSFAVQGIGGGIMAGADDKDAIDLGQNVILVGLGIQIAFFVGFIIVISIFHYRILRQPTQTSQETPLPWSQYILILYFVSLLILIRSLFRVAEFAAGQTSVLQTSEAYVYCLDTMLMFFVCVVFNVRHPSQVVQNPNYKSMDHEMEDGRVPTDEAEVLTTQRH